MTDPVAELMRQGALDFVEAVEPVIAPASDRLVILACSDTKAQGDNLAARDRYNGPLWQTLRAVDPDTKLAQVAYLSALYGLGSAKSVMPEYNQRMTATAAAQMIERGIAGWHPYRAQLPTTTAGMEKWVRSRHPLRTAAGEVAGMLRGVKGGFRDVVIVGGRQYVEVGVALVKEFQDCGYIEADARVSIINDQIGFMRAELRRWLMDADEMKMAA